MNLIIINNILNYDEYHVNSNAKIEYFIIKFTYYFIFLIYSI